MTPAAEPTIDVPTLPTSLTCDEAAAYVAPDAIFSNGETGTCMISGTVSGVKSENFTICGGTITITYTIQPGDNCNRGPITVSEDIQVTPAPNPVISVPQLPASLTCEEALVYNAPNATYTNNAADAACLISGTTPGVPVSDFAECGGTITITWTVATGCDNNSVTETATIPVTPADEPTITVPVLPTSLTCDEAASYIAPDATFGNGETGACAINGIVGGVKTEDFTICGGTITITYTIDAGDNCNRGPITVSADIPVTPAPNPTISVPQLPGSLTCEEAATYSAPNASFSNNAADADCLISGNAPGVVSNDFTECGGSITITWTASTGCDNNSVTETAMIPVTPAAEPTISVPTLPTSLTCDEAASYVAPDATYTNNQTGTCMISGTVSGMKSENFTICGGTITITYTIQPGDNCNRGPITVSENIPVTPAPNPVISVPQLPGSLTCEEAATYSAPNASFSNNAADVSCLIAGSAPGVVTNDFTECGGSITITWTASTGCDNNSVTETATILVTPAADPIIVSPQLPTSITCDEAAIWTAPSTTYSNGNNGACSISGTIDGVVTPNFTVCGGTLTVTYTVDPSANCARPISITETITVLPAPSPQFMIPDLPLSLSCETAGSYVAPDALFSNGGSDSRCLISGTAQGVITRDFGSCGGSITITWTTPTGCDNNAVVATRTIPVDQPAAPTISCPGPLTLDCNDPNLDAQISAWLASASAQAGCGASVSIENDFDQLQFTGGCSATTGSKTVTFRAIDECGTSSICTATIDIVDNSDPVWTTDPSDLTVECSDPNLNQIVQDWINNQGGGTATDVCSQVGFSSDFTGFDRNCNGTTTVTFTAEDECGNDVSRSAVITVIDATDPEIINVDPDITIDCGESFQFSNPTVSDNCDTDIELEAEDQGTLDPCQGGTIIRVWTATDECGNVGTAQQRVTLTPDNADPIFTSVLPQNMTVSCDNIPAPAMVEADDCTAVTITFDEDDQIVECGRRITRTWTATDACNNSVSHTQVITVECPVAGTVAATGGVNCDNPNAGSATVTVTSGQAPFSYLWSNGETAATATNLSDGAQTVRVTDVSGCQITLNVNIEADFTPPTVSATGGTVTCDEPSITLMATTSGTIIGWTGPNGFTSSQASPAVSAAGTYTVTAEAANGCTATATAVVSEDLTPPTVSATGGTITCDQSSVTLGVTTNGTLIGWTGPGGFSSTQSSPTVSTVGQYVVTVEGANGCTATATVTVDENLIKPSDDVTTVTICSDELPFVWNGRTYNASANDRIVNDACTADLVLNLTVTPKPADIVTTETVCSDELPFVWNGRTYNGSATDRIEGANCTADLVLNLTVTPKPADQVTTVTICSDELPFVWNGRTFNGSATDRIEGTGCTADLVLNLTVTPKPADQVTTVTICSDELPFCLLYTSPSPRDRTRSRMPSSA